MKMYQEFPTGMLVDDYLAAQKDWQESCDLLPVAREDLDRACRWGAKKLAQEALHNVALLQERIDDNGKVMYVIERELKRRGELSRLKRHGVQK